MKESDTSEEPSEEELKDAVMAYLADHPEAMDTLEGIADWWIPQKKVSISRLARALTHLTTTGALQQIGTGAMARYRLKEHERSTE